MDGHNQEISSEFIPQVLSVVFLVFYLCMIIPLRYCKYQKDIEQQYASQAATRPKNVLQFAANCSIFEYLDALTVEAQELNMLNTRESQQSHTKSQENMDINQPNQLLMKNLQKRAKKQNTRQYHQRKFDYKPDREFSGAVICDCYECCCQGCPWQLSKDNVVFTSISKIISRISNSFYYNMKMISYIIIKYGSFVFLPINNLLSFSNSFYGAFVCGVILNSLEFFVLIFTISFINTRRYSLKCINREMVRLEKHNQIQRALLLYYHLKKGFIFTTIYALILLVVTYIIKNVFEDNDQFNENPFQFLNFAYDIMTNLLLLALLKYSGCLSNDLISDDDRILKAQQRLYAIQNNLVKYFPSEEVWLQYLVNQLEARKFKQMNPSAPQISFEFIPGEQDTQRFLNRTQEIKQELATVLEHNCLIAKEKLVMHVHVVDDQKFKKIKKNLGTQRCQITFLTIYIYFHVLAQFVLSILLSLVLVNIQQQSTLSGVDQFSEKYQITIYIMYYTLGTLEYTLIPYLIGVMCNKKALLGQDYGHKFKSGQGGSLTSDSYNLSLQR